MENKKKLYSVLVLALVSNNSMAMFSWDLQKSMENRIFKNINDVRFKEFRNTFSSRFNYDFESKKFGSLKPDGNGGKAWHEEKLDAEDKELIADYKKLAASRQKKISAIYDDGNCEEHEIMHLAGGLGAFYAAVTLIREGKVLFDEYKPANNWSDLPAVLGLGVMAYLSYKSFSAGLHLTLAGLNYKAHMWQQQQEINKICKDFEGMVTQ
jgi:hypothetical protein